MGLIKVMTAHNRIRTRRIPASVNPNIFFIGPKENFIHHPPEI
jgi:hypothetical protein